MIIPFVNYHEIRDAKNLHANALKNIFSSPTLATHVAPFLGSVSALPLLLGGDPCAVAFANH